MRQRTRRCIDTCMKPVQAYLLLFRPYIEVENILEAKFIAAQKDKPMPELIETANKHLNEAKFIEQNLPIESIIGPFKIVAGKIIHRLCHKHTLLAQAVLNYARDQLMTSIEDTHRDLSIIFNKMNSLPGVVEDLFELKNWIENLPELIEGFESRIGEIVANFELLMAEGYQFEQEDSSMFWSLRYVGGVVFSFIHFRPTAFSHTKSSTKYRNPSTKSKTRKMCSASR